MSLFNFCASPRTMHEIVVEGYTRDMVYNAVKKGALLNLNRKDLWGRTQHGKGLFQVSDTSMHCMQAKFDAGRLINAWGQRP